MKKRVIVLLSVFSFALSGCNEIISSVSNLSNLLKTGADKTGTIRNQDVMCENFSESYTTLDALQTVAAMTGLLLAVSKMPPEYGGKPEAFSPDIMKLYASEQIWMPTTLEDYLAKSKHEDLVSSGFVLEKDNSRKSIERYRALDEMLALVNQAIPVDYPFPINAFVLNSGVELYATSAGYIYVGAEYLTNKKMKDKGTISLAHEITHIVKRHKSKELQMQLIDSIRIAIPVLQGLKSGQVSPLALIALKDSMAKHFEDYSAQQEVEADTCAIRVANTLPSIENPELAVVAYKRLLKDKGQGNSGKTDEHGSLVDRYASLDKAFLFHSPKRAMYKQKYLEIATKKVETTKN
jgi:hypothetical protein